MIRVVMRSIFLDPKIPRFYTSKYDNKCIREILENQFLKAKTNKKIDVIKISVKKFIYLLNYKQLKFYLNEARERKKDKVKNN